ncbi:MAG: glycoside hydrolase family 43 protein [Clostridia bacterium]|nr:glycoside hydrolase family 43 protein [Clostridia bacterium]
MKQILMLMLAVLLLGGVPAGAEELKTRDLGEAADWFVSNPRNVKDIGDPFVLPEEGTYYVFATGGPIGFNAWLSSDLREFGKMKALKKVDWASGDYWAPEVFRVNDRYVMLFTARMRENGSLRTGIAFSDTPEGPYEDPLGRPLMDYGYATIDATMTWDDEGNPYLIYVRDCSENTVNGRQESHIYGVRLKSDLTGTEGDPVLLLKPEGDWEIRSGDTLWNEGPAVVKRDGRYTLFYSVNGYWMKEYSVSAAVSDTPLGPYIKQGNNPLLYYTEADGNVTVSGPGHNAFFTVGEELFTAYHTHTYPQAPSGNRQLCVDRAGFHADGTTYINGPTLAPQLRPLSEIGKMNLAPEAACAEDPSDLLTDGDFCLREGSSPWVWQGQEVNYVWPEGVTAELLMIYPANGQSVSGKVLVNGVMEAAFGLKAGQAPGTAAMLLTEPTKMTDLKITFDAESGIGEILVIGTR